MDALTLGAKGLAAGGKNMQLGRLLHDALGQRRELVEDVFAAVENQQHPPAAQECQQAWYRVLGIDGQAKRGGNGAGNEPGIRQRAEIDEAHLAIEARKLAVRDGERDGGFADAPRTDDGDEAMQGKLGGNLLDRIVSPDHPRKG
ncbi:hypothetical protein ACVWXO_005836 [Bradyrhizobium sp. LM2.7]